MPNFGKLCPDVDRQIEMAHNFDVRHIEHRSRLLIAEVTIPVHSHLFLVRIRWPLKCWRIILA